MRMLRWCCGHTRRDRVRNDDIRDRVGVAPKCFQDVRLITINRPGRLELPDQGLRLVQTVQETGRPINRRPIAINRPSRVCGRPARLGCISELGLVSCLIFCPKPIRVSLLSYPTFSASQSLSRTWSCGGEEDDSDHDADARNEAQEGQPAPDPVVPMEEDEDTRGDGGAFRVDVDLLE